MKKGHKFEIKKTVNLDILQGKRINFAKLIEYMLPPNEKVKGCQILFPDTVFFGHGKPQFIAKNDKEGCLMIIQQANKLALQDIRQKFSTISRERKKETQPIIFKEVTPDQLGERTIKSPQNGQGRQVSLNKDSDDEGQKAINEEKSIYYKDSAIFRFIVEEGSGSVQQQL